MSTGDLAPHVCETHTGVVALVGDRAYKVKKAVTTDFLDFSTPELRLAACEREVALNRRLSPDSYLGIGHFTDPQTGAREPVIVMRRYPDRTRLATMVTSGRPVHAVLDAVSDKVAAFHRGAVRGDAVDACGRLEAVGGRWRQNLDQLDRYTALDRDCVREIRRLAEQFMKGRTALFNRRIADKCIVDGHGDLLAGDIFSLPDRLAILDCLEFDDTLRFVDVLDDAAFLAMDLEFLGRPDLGEFFLDAYRRYSGDTAPKSLAHFYIAYRAGVRAKTDCVRMVQGREEALDDARRHLEIARSHLQAAAVQLVIVGGGPGTGKTTLSRALAEHFDAVVISTDEVRKELQSAGVISGRVGEYNAGLYAPENVEKVYTEVLRRAEDLVGGGTSVILDGTWRDERYRERVRELGSRSATPVTELTCAAPLRETQVRIETRGETVSDATPDIAAAIAATAGYGGHLIDTTRPLGETVDEARQICCAAI